jgi:hypothetical protein
MIYEISTTKEIVQIVYSVTVHFRCFKIFPSKVTSEKPILFLQVDILFPRANKFMLFDHGFLQKTRTSACLKNYMRDCHKLGSFQALFSEKGKRASHEELTHIHPSVSCFYNGLKSLKG